MAKKKRQIVILQKNELDCISMIFLHYEITISAKWHKQIIKTQAEPKYEQIMTIAIKAHSFTDVRR